ncbi:hypothetical protein EDC01DRAFT_788548 [Geopyxis carbonaria]|nr:hypothetical protein EDC01DRAFT_788548 [Geopyxis carbonaria]
MSTTTTTSEIPEAGETSGPSLSGTLKATAASLPPHPFVCPLNTAAAHNLLHPHNIVSLPQLLQQRAEECPDLPAVGLALPKENKPDAKWKFKIHTYAELLDLAKSTAAQLCAAGIQPGRTVAILLPTGFDMLAIFLGLIWIGSPVLLLATQCNAKSIRHLMHITPATLLLYTKTHEATVRSAGLNSSKWMSTMMLPFPTTESPPPVPPPAEVSPESVAYIHHTSGTTGFPKPIFTPHAASTVHLPCIPGAAPTLTTTPLYHGGTADLWRSVMSRGMLWLWSSEVPITASNIVTTLNIARWNGGVGYLTGVPYVINMMAESDEGMDAMRKLEMVGVGGAMLPETIGNTLANAGVNIVSRFGNTECGFIMTSYRHFDSDKAWNYLRVPEDEQYLQFEPRENDLYELVIKPGWPLIAKCNRPDGSYATSDLFSPHPTIPGAWKYLTRNDSTIVLTSGKKFNPEPIEDALRELDVVKEAIVFGQNKEWPGVMIFSAAGADSKAVRRAVVAKLAEINESLPVHARILDELVAVMGDRDDWPKTSKGTPIRWAAEKQFADIIRIGYGTFSGDVGGEKVAEKEDGDEDDFTEEDMLELVQDVVKAVVGYKLGDEDDFFAHGVDSIMAARIRRGLLRSLYLSCERKVPSNIVYEMRNIKRLTQFFNGKEVETKSIEDQMRDMVNRYSIRPIPLPSPGSPKDLTIILTGATGALGVHILHALTSSSLPIRHIFTPIRGRDDITAARRLRCSCVSRGFSPRLNELIIPISAWTPLSGIAGPAPLIIHAAWPVNFLAPLPSFAPILEDLRDLLKLGGRLVFCSSVASTANPASSDPVPERFSTRPEDAGALGYSQSKWVAESMLQSHPNTDIVRLGQLSGDTKKGIWNPEEGWPQLLASVKDTDCLPLLGSEGGRGERDVSWLPVDIAAKAIVAIAERTERDPAQRVWHVLNPKPLPWTQILDAADTHHGRAIPRVPNTTWLSKLPNPGEGVPGEETRLLGLWESLYGDPHKPSGPFVWWEKNSREAAAKEAAANGKTEEEEKRDVRWDTKHTAKLVPELGEGVELDAEYLGRVFKAWAIGDGRTFVRDSEKEHAEIVV